MMIWFLVLWSASVPPFEAGQYQTYERCEAAAAVQVIALRGVYGPGRLKWMCRPGLSWEG
jgi:hypothetical protein